MGGTRGVKNCCCARVDKWFAGAGRLGLGGARADVWLCADPLLLLLAPCFVVVVVTVAQASLQGADALQQEATQLQAEVQRVEDLRAQVCGGGFGRGDDEPLLCMYPVSVWSPCWVAVGRQQ